MAPEIREKESRALKHTKTRTLRCTHKLINACTLIHMHTNTLKLISTPTHTHEKSSLSYTDAHTHMKEASQDTITL